MAIVKTFVRFAFFRDGKILMICISFSESFLPLIQWPTWQFLPPRWNKTFRNAQDDLDILLNFGKKQVDAAKKRMSEKKTDDINEMSVLEKLIIRNGPESTYPLVTAIDMIFAGIDTTGTYVCTTWIKFILKASFIVFRPHTTIPSSVTPVKPLKPP